MSYLLPVFLLLLAGCCNNAYTLASKNFVTIISEEYELDQALIDQTMADDCISYAEGSVIYQTIGVPYGIKINEDTTLSEFDLRIRTRYLNDYKDATYGR